MTKAKQEQCSETVRRGRGRYTPCLRPAVLREGGKWWCRQHAPTKEAAQRVKDAEAAVVDVAVKWRKLGIAFGGTPDMPIAVHVQLVIAVDKLLNARHAAKQ